MLKEAVARFAAEEVAPKVAAMEANEALEPAIIDGMFEMGLMGVEVPEEHGGAGMSFTAACLAIEELAKVDAGVSVTCDVQNTLVCNTFLNFASDEMKAEYLPRLTSDTLAAFCLSEASCGSDAFALKTTAIADGDDYVLNGEKMWITNAKEAGLFVVYANVNPTAGYKGITAFVVERDAPGLSVGNTIPKLGLRSSSTCPVVLEDVRVSKSAILGEEGLGYKYSIETLNEGRIGIAAQMVGIAQGAFDAAMEYVFERKAFGKPVGEFDSMRAEYASISCQIAAARLLTYEAARRKEHGLPFVKHAAQAKYVAAQAAEATTSKAIEWAGGVGFAREYPMEKRWRDSKIGAIYEGTNLIQLQTIAKLVASEYK
ncbi:acyl-CoA dehydrogenase [Thecamonas trahens ATCC 50062]|uniref:Short/branched chain specific acyl-CoA dehydrogenase, mitochondrial n=1 Tax=Thecamonas trahens ATCC 50062 TaxID=461836 RepID=A0A0L0DKT2_THETB|nr:acyl-CoA dehydrogenase [Thecamonas trahens ATCC 50062]KNC52917.1 acyl-CoA dehydrogenase [Thecamonas trahens ATCC 50062]|eukprot:XP_013754813.1 acyl-CoA dehydrogenase [Thecamonas trahens ATCC 50062]